MKKIISKSIIAIIALGASTTAYASVHTYNLDNGTVLTVNSATGQGSAVGNDINASFTGDFSGFTGGENPTGISIPIDNLQGTRVINGRTIAATPQNLADHGYSLNFENNGELNLWARWGSDNQYGDYISTPSGYSYAPNSSSTSSGGLSSTGGVSTSSTGGVGGGAGGSAGASAGGGTDVPAPGALLLFGLGAAGLAFGNRRRKANQK